jgi:hypothetical protein
LIPQDIDLLNDLLKNLTSHVWKTQASQVKAKIDSNLFTAFPEFVHMHERRARVQSKSGKMGKLKTSYNTIKATKPSTITTVAPWERESIQELYDSPWEDLHNLEKEFNKTSALDRDYDLFSKKLSSIIDAQWSNKQLVLRKTTHRLVLSGLNDQTPLWQRLNKVRTILIEFKSIDTCDRETLSRIISAYDILPQGLVNLEGDYKKSWIAAFKDGDLRERFPCTSRLIDQYKENTTVAPPDVSSG